MHNNCYHKNKEKGKEQQKKKKSSKTNYTSHTSIPTYSGNGQQEVQGSEQGARIAAKRHAGKNRKCSNSSQ